MNLKELMAEAIDGEKTGIRFLHFRTDKLTPQEAQKVVEAIGQYNGFKPEKVNQALADIAGLYGGVGVEVGREFSPCLYLSVQGLPISHREDIKNILASALPDELDFTDYSDKLQEEAGPRIRAWWD